MSTHRRPLLRRAVLASGALAVLAALAACARPPRPAEIEAANPPRGAFVQSEGLRVHYVESGPVDAPAVVLIHGATGNLNDMTFDLAPRLADRFRVIAFDRPGLGYTERPEARGWDPAVQARVLRGAAEALGVERPVLVGHSWGAAVAMAWAVQTPEAVAGVVAVSGATMPYDDGENGPWTHIVTSRLAAGIGVRVLKARVEDDGGRATLERIFRPQEPPEGYLDHLQPELLLRPESFRANVEDIVRLDAALARLAPRYDDLDVPVEVLHGTADRIVGPTIHAEPLAERLPRAELRLFEGVGHMLHHARPEAVVAAVERLAS